MVRYRYVPDRTGMDPWFVSPEAHALCLLGAEEAAAYAKTIAPVGQPPDDKHPGFYRDSIHVDRTPRIIPRRGRFSARTSAAVVADAPYSAVIEVQRGHRVLQRAAARVNTPKPGRRV